LYAAKSVQINFAVMNAKSNGNKSRSFVQDAESFFSEMFINSSLIIVTIAMRFFVVENAKADGLENITDSNLTHITQVRG